MHPLYADVVRRALPTRRSAAHARRLVAAHADASEPADAVLQFRLMIWRVDAGEVLAPRRRGRRRVARPARARREPGHPHHCLGRGRDPRRPRSSRSSARRCANSAGPPKRRRSSAGSVESRGGTTPDDETIAFHAFSRAENLFFGLGRIDEAYDVLRRAVVQVETDELRAELVAHLAVFDTFCGRLGAADRGCRGVPRRCRAVAATSKPRRPPFPPSRSWVTPSAPPTSHAGPSSKRAWGSPTKRGWRRRRSIW